MSIRNSKFFKTINQSDSEVLSQRSELIAGDAEQAMKDVVDDLKQRIRTKTGERLKLQDFGRTSKDSLQIVDAEFDVNKWASDLHEVSVEIKALELELEIAVSNYDSYFGEELPPANYSNVTTTNG